MSAMTGFDKSIRLHVPPFALRHSSMMLYILPSHQTILSRIEISPRDTPRDQARIDKIAIRLTQHVHVTRNPLHNPHQRDQGVNERQTENVDKQWRLWNLKAYASIRGFVSTAGRCTVEQDSLDWEDFLAFSGRRPLERAEQDTCTLGARVRKEVHVDWRVRLCAQGRDHASKIALLRAHWCVHHVWHRSQDHHDARCGHERGPLLEVELYVSLRSIHPGVKENGGRGGVMFGRMVEQGRGRQAG